EPGDPQGGGRPGADPVALDEVNTLDVGVGDAALPEEPAAGVGLVGGEPEPAATIATDEEVDRGVAEVADAVEDDDRSHRRASPFGRPLSAKGRAGWASRSR